MTTRSPFRCRAALLAGTVSSALLLAACSGPSTGSPAPAPRAADSLTGTVTVLAAASLTEVFGDLAARFEKLHPSVTITESFGGSSALAAQIVQGAPADLFATANEATMKTVTDAGLADGTPRVFATNVLTLVVPPSNPAGITALSDLAEPDVKVALCDTTVPCGSAALALLAAEKLTVTPVTLETDVKAVLTKVELDEVDAGLVYATDARTAGSKISQIAVPDAAHLINRYPIVALSGSTNQAAAHAFEQFILSSTGRAALKNAGFGTP
ncbi:MAG TPA: molybdate ABC transporter substrate-binding protein [Pseudolysinimonas sp.]|nr:molybdate ABC transporter substrate-binding protein [Pseudolysinimonas sp.]